MEGVKCLAPSLWALSQNLDNVEDLGDKIVGPGALSLGGGDYISLGSGEKSKSTRQYIASGAETGQGTAYNGLEKSEPAGANSENEGHPPDRSQNAPAREEDNEEDNIDKEARARAVGLLVRSSLAGKNGGLKIWLQGLRDGSIPIDLLEKLEWHGGADRWYQVQEQIELTKDRLLTYLEMEEAKYAQYGFFDTTVTGAYLIENFFDRDVAKFDFYDIYKEAALRLLREEGLILPLNTEEDPARWQFRSRMGEVVRLLNSLRQRFPGQRYYYESRPVVADLKYHVRPRHIPHRHIPLDNYLKSGINEVLLSGMEEQRRLEVALDILKSALKENGRTTFSDFQLRSFKHIFGKSYSLNGDTKDEGLVIAAGTGSGKTLAFFVPVLLKIVLEKALYPGPVIGTKLLALYPRTKLAENQFGEFVRYVYLVNRELRRRGINRAITAGVEYGCTPYQRAQLSDKDVMAGRQWSYDQNLGGHICPYASCPACGKRLYTPLAQDHPQFGRLVCEDPGCEVASGLDFVTLTKEDWSDSPPDILVALTESLNNRLNSPAHQNIFGLGKFCAPRFIMLDEIHLQSSIKGMQVGFLIRRLLQRIHYHQLQRGMQERVQVIGLSATISEPRQFFKDLTGIRQRITVESPLDPEEMTVRGAEYLILLQAPRHGEAQVLSTLIQATMCLIHNMAQPREGHLYQTFGFVNSRDVLYRWRDQMEHAEGQGYKLPDSGVKAQGLYFLRHPKLIRTSRQLRSYMVAPVKKDCRECSEVPETECPLYREGECWWMMGRHRTLETPIRAVAKSAWSGEFDPADHLVMATSALEVGYDYNKLMAVLQYLAPPDLASFVQRHGRAGRSVGSRPIMLAVLSPHRSQDNFYFYNDFLLNEPDFSRLPLNPNNLLVLRIHGLYALFDWLAYEMASRGVSGATFPEANGIWLRHCLKLTSSHHLFWPLMGYLARALSLSGAKGRPELRRVLAGPRGVLSYALPQLVRLLSKQGRGNVKELMNDYLPSALFADINLPEIDINWGGQKVKERIDLGLQETMVGKVTYRWEQPMWIPPESLEKQSPTCYTLPLGRFWLAGSREGTLGRTEVPLKWQKLLMGRHPQDELQVFRPREVTLRPFFYPNQGGQSKWVSRWVYDPSRDEFKERGRYEKIGGRLRVSPRSNTYPITTYQVRLPRQSVAWADERRLGPLAGAITRIVPANDKSGFMEVIKVTLGAEASLLCDGEQVYRRIAFRDGQRSFAGLGYKMITDGLRFEIDPQLHRRFQPSQDLLSRLRHNLFLYSVYRLAQEEGWGMYFTVKNMLEVVQTWIGLMQDEGEDWRKALEDGTYRAGLEKVLKNFYPFSGEKCQEILNLLAQEQVRRGLAETHRRVEKMPGHEVVRDILIHSLKHALKKACQSLAGVETPSEMGAWARLSLDFPDDIQPVIDIFEYGMYGGGSMRAVQRKLEDKPREFWREVTWNIQHCHLGDEEEFLRAILILPEQHLQNIGALVQRFTDSTDISSRRKIKYEIEEYFRRELGLSPLGPRFKSLRRVFANSLDLAEFPGQALENWRLCREVEMFRLEREKNWGRPLTAHEVGELFAARLQERFQQGESPDPQRAPWLVLLKYYQEQRQKDMKGLWKTIRVNCKKPFYNVLFSHIKNRKELEWLIEMGEDERIDVLYEILEKHLPGPARDYLTRDNVDAFAQGAFFTVEGFSLANVYYELLGPAGERTGRDYKEIIATLMVAGRIKRAIRQRALNTCPDVCPSCLAGPCEVEPPGLSQLLLSRRLLREMLEHWRTTVSGCVVEVEEGDSHKKLARKVQRVFRRRMGQEVFLRYRMQQHEVVDRALSLLLDEGIKLSTGEIFEVEVLGDKIDFSQSGPRGLAYERALGIRGDRVEISK